jgi:hypothetical protein
VPPGQALGKEMISFFFKKLWRVSRLIGTRQRNFILKKPFPSATIHGIRQRIF